MTGSSKRIIKDETGGRLSVDPALIPDHLWEVESDDGVSRTEIYFDEPSGLVCRRRMYYSSGEALKYAAELRNETKNERFGNLEKRWRKVAEVPMNVWAQSIAQKRKDKDHLLWWLRQEEAKKFLTFEKTLPKTWNWK